MITYLLPTRDRSDTLRTTLQKLGDLSAAAHETIGGAEVIVVDNASSPAASLPTGLDNGFKLTGVRRKRNKGVAARNIGAHLARGEWIVMLDDDSYPLDSQHIEVLRSAPPDVAAIGADIFLPGGLREAGGLPEVIIGCGAAIRRDAFLDVGGYDPSFDYYAEEYDLCAKFLLKGWRVIHDQRFRVRHEKINTHRDMNRILHRLVRNNGWVAQRYAPDDVRDAELAEIVSRYARISVKEQAARGFAEGMTGLLQSLNAQPRRTMSAETFDRFTGLAHARVTFGDEPTLRSRSAVAIVDEGKNSWAVRTALEEIGANMVDDERNADVLVIGTLSPGPMMDAWERRIADSRTQGRPVLRGWSMQGQSRELIASAA